MVTRHFITLFVLAALWGASFLFMRVASPALGPVVLIDLRVLIAGLVLVVYAGITRRRPVSWRKWPQYLLLGILNAAIPFSLIAAAELTLDASVAAILNALTPLFTAVIAHVWTHDRLTKHKLGALALGVVGVGVLVGGNAHLPIARMFIAVGLSLGAACCYGIGGVFASLALKNEEPLTLAIGQQLAAGLVLLPLAVFLLPHAVPAPTVMAAVLGLALLSTSLAYLLYFHLMRSIGPVKTLSVTFLVPVFGVLWGRIFLHEPLSASMLGGLSVILLSVAVVTDVPTRWRRTGLPDRSGMRSD